MFKFIKNLFGKKEIEQPRQEDYDNAIVIGQDGKPLGKEKIGENRFGIKSKVRAKAVSDDDASQHVRAGDFCNNCDVHISNCPYWKTRI